MLLLINRHTVLLLDGGTMFVINTMQTLNNTFLLQGSKNPETIQSSYSMFFFKIILNFNVLVVFGGVVCLSGR